MKQKIRLWLAGFWLNVKHEWEKQIVITEDIWFAVAITIMVSVFMYSLDWVMDYWIPEPHEAALTEVVSLPPTDILPTQFFTSTPDPTRTPLPTFAVPTVSEETPTEIYIPPPTAQIIVIVETVVVEPTKKDEPSPAPTATPITTRVVAWPTSPPEGTPWTPPPQPETPVEYTIVPTGTPDDPPTKVATPVPTELTPSYPNP